MQKTSTSADTMAPNFKVTLTQYQTIRSAECTDKIVAVTVAMQRPAQTIPDSSEATTGACDSKDPEDRGGPTGAVQCQSRGRASDQGTASSHDPEDCSMLLSLVGRRPPGTRTSEWWCYWLSDPKQLKDKMNRLDDVIQSTMRPTEENVEKNIAMLMAGIEKRADVEGFMQNVDDKLSDL